MGDRWMSAMTAILAISFFGALFWMASKAPDTVEYLNEWTRRPASNGMVLFAVILLWRRHNV